MTSSFVLETNSCCNNNKSFSHCVIYNDVLITNENITLKHETASYTSRYYISDNFVHFADLNEFKVEN